MSKNSQLNSKTVSQSKLEYSYRSMLRIRRFEETVLGEFSRGHFFGTTHTYIGQEANAVGVLENIDSEDIVVSNHRSHGEIMGKSTGVSGGRGGSQHLHWKNFYSNGVLGGTIPIATGLALAEKFNQRETITVTFLGDGALGEGILYESLNMASLWSAPILFVLENNHIAQTTPVEMNLAGDIASRFSAFSIETEVLDTSDVLEIQSAARQSISEVRKSSSPRALILNTYRFGPHSKGDDTRPKEQILALQKNRDPLLIHEKHLNQDQINTIAEEVNHEVSQAFQEAIADPFPEFNY
jgi:TPP-dependent pyruvate/acetoin dehydrogenase alpha subunit